MCYRWEFTLLGKKYLVELYDSKLSGNKQVMLDSRILYHQKYKSQFNFSYSFSINYVSLSIAQFEKGKYDLLIEGNSFQDMMKKEKEKEKIKI